MKNLVVNAVEKLENKIKGRVILPNHSDYNDIRKIWNAMIDRRPALIVQVLDADDVAHAIRFARDNDIDISIRGAGHNIGGNSMWDGGLVIDFSNMKNVRVDAEKRRAYVQPGATLAEFDKATQAHGLTTPTGINSTTGIAGLTLGGGFGWLTRQYGMTIDNLISAEIVTADGKILHVSKDESPDLFWAIRGGGGNFGVVTEFEFRLHPVGPEVFAGLIVFPIEQAKQVLKQYREFVKTAPNELSVWVVLRQAPPLPFLPEEVHGKEVVVLPVFYNGAGEEGEKFVETLRSFGDPHGEHTGMQPYTAWQQAFDPLLTPGFRNYWKSHNFMDLNDDAFNTMIKFANNLPSSHCDIFMALLGGAANDIDSDATAYAHRDANFVLNVHGRWEEKDEDQKCMGWAREFFRAAAPYASGGAYTNFMTEDETDRVAAAYGSNYERLSRIKMKYDPENIFHLNQNIKPELMAK